MQNQGKDQKAQPGKPAAPPASGDQPAAAPAEAIKPAPAPPASAPEKVPSGPKTYDIMATAAPTALVVHCGDPRFQAPIALFLKSELGLVPGEYIPLIVRGGVASLNLAEILPKEAKYPRETAKAYLETFGSMRRVVLINHEDCGKYKGLQKAMSFLFTSVEGIANRQVGDLHKVAEIILGFSPRHVEVEKYMAKFANSEHTKVKFEKL